MNVITYGTFDVLHYGHIELLRRAKVLAGTGLLIVGLSTDKFNEIKGKKSVVPFEKRKDILSAIKYVDKIIVEDSREQKERDIYLYDAQFVMGDDWKGKFDKLGCQYIQRTKDISSSLIKEAMKEG